MQENITNKTAEAIRLVKWLSEHPKIQSRLFEDYSQTTPEECLEIIEILEKNGFYEMIVALLMKNQFNMALEQVISEFVIDKMIKEWERVGTEQMCQDIKERIREKIQLSDAGWEYPFRNL